jgi:hypothetical protein
MDCQMRQSPVARHRRQVEDVPTSNDQCIAVLGCETMCVVCVCAQAQAATRQSSLRHHLYVLRLFVYVSLSIGSDGMRRSLQPPPPPPSFKKPSSKVHHVAFRETLNQF